ncbi:hypothetical protein SAMN05216266_10675 [Amycolatopsis marina]|uniref:DUF308 domain-containing protein n=1 Tax=Amycolatopsis marina TaxID=490629 RepID=A0A1I0Z2Q6_9PSEU|nr:hypothetical protein [Amycolatopsis marina]SFB20009.1 hypothetical protein SAMN05216266_10675 [Amycolatopsis marina]
MMNEATERSTVRHSTGLHVFLWTAFPACGAVLGIVLAQVPGWIAALPWFPNQESIADLAGVIGVKTTVALAVAGVLAGGFVALLAYDDIVTVTIDEDSVAVKRNDSEAVFPGAAVSGAFADGKELVLLGPHGEELAREKTDLRSHRLRAGFEAHGYDWHEHDPYGERFTRWIDGSSGLSQDAHAILRARQTAIENDDAEDLRDLRRELSRHGVFVRDEGKRQYWRTAQ